MIFFLTVTPGEPVTVMQESQETESEGDRKSQDSDVNVKETKRPKLNGVYVTR